MRRRPRVAPAATDADRAEAAVLALEIGSFLAAAKCYDRLAVETIADDAIHLRDWLWSADRAYALAARMAASRRHLTDLRRADPLPSARTVARFVKAAGTYERVLLGAPADLRRLPPPGPEAGQ